MLILEYERKFLTLEDARIIRLLGKFEVMDTHIIISPWLKGDDFLANDLSRFWIACLFYKNFQIEHMTTMIFFFILDGEDFCRGKDGRRSKLLARKLLTPIVT